MAEFPPCPKCNADLTYPCDGMLVCPMCFHEWNPNEAPKAEQEEITDTTVKDAHGNVLQDGDTVIVIKDLPVKGSSKPVKAGTKVKNIRLSDGDHNIDCKIDGFGAMSLKSEFVKKG
ncbi:MAG TPA: zinc ribbon domain-containing protein YjdM [Bacteroidia bacterium]